MGWSIFEFLVVGILWNILFIIFGIIARARAAKRKSYIGYVIAGSIITFIPYFGNIAGSLRNPEIYKISTLRIPFISYLILLCLFIYLCTKEQKKSEQGDEVAVNENGNNSH